jgi:hypothetical protein
MTILFYEDVANLSKVNYLYQEMVHNVVEFKTLDFSELREPRIGYVEQIPIQSSQVVMATACAIHYSLYPVMVIRYLKGEYVGENRNVSQILRGVSPHIDKTDAAHIKRILSQDCPLRLSFEETSVRKASIIQKAIKQHSRCTWRL